MLNIGLCNRVFRLYSNSFKITG